MTEENTSARVAAMAARIVRADDAALVRMAQQEPDTIRSVAASAMTQAPDRDADS